MILHRLQKIVDSVYQSFYPLYSLPKEYENKNRDYVDCKAIIAKYSRGNTSLQLGNFSTQEDIENRLKAISDFNFIDK